MPQVLTTNAIITCPHGGVGTTTPSDPKWSVNGGFVLLENDIGVLSCVFIVPCVGYTLRSMGLNASKIGQRKVVLVTDFNQSVTGLPLTMLETHQVIDNSTPAPIPAGQSAPPLSAALADAIKPVVTVAPPAMIFTALPSPTPPANTATFSLSSDYPLLWKLILISEPAGPSRDLTNGPYPPGLQVLPEGGDWSTPSLTVTINIDATFMASLGIGVHHFYLTGVNQRGLSQVVETVLTVS
jgi:hypothetical protein